MYKIYHNSRCRKSRAGLAYLQEKVKDYQIIEYLKEPLTAKQLEQILLKTGKKPFDFVRKQEEDYKKELKGKEFTDHEWVEILTKNPKLLERPIVESTDKAVLAQPPEEIDNIL